MKQKRYKNIIFDLGGVLVNFNPKQIAQELFPKGTSTAEFLELLRMQPFYDLCKGLIAPNQATDLLAEQSRFDREVFATFFQKTPNSLVPLSQGLSILRKAKQNGCNIFVLSNIDEICHKAIQHHDFFSEVDGSLMSYQHKCVKPDSEIYEKFLTLYNLKPEECLFIDDLPENIEGAQACGIDGILCDDHNRVEQKLKTLGVL